MRYIRLPRTSTGKRVGRYGHAQSIEHKMPALVFLGRRWHIASDDLPLFSFTGVFFHAALAPFLAACLGMYTACLSSSLIAFISLLLALDVVSSALFLALGLVSMRGTMLEQHKRSQASTLLMLLTYSYLMLLGLSCFGVYAVLYLSPPQQACGGPWGVMSFCRAILSLHWAAVATFFISWLVVWNPFSGKSNDLDVWMRRCKCLISLACLSSQQHPRLAIEWDMDDQKEDPINQVAILFHGLLSHVDLTLSDYATSLILVGILQKMRRRKAREVIEHQDRDLEDPESQPRAREPHESTVSREDLIESQHYYEFAAGAYGWMMRVYRHRLRPCQACAVCCGCCACCLPSRAVEPHPSASTAEKYRLSLPRNLHVEAIIRATGIASSDILYHSLDNKVEGLLPYFIAIDRGRRSVVLSIRGSWSGTDVLTDILCWPSKVDHAWMNGRPPAPTPATISSGEDNEEEAVYAHQGKWLGILPYLCCSRFDA